MLKFVLTVSLAFTSFNAYSCIWQSHFTDGSSPFWPDAVSGNSKIDIEVCFLPPKQNMIPNPNSLNLPNIPDPENTIDAAYRNQYKANMSTVKAAVESQINARSKFNLTGFEYCPENDTGAKIRIEMNDKGRQGAEASGFGPRSNANAVPSITMTSFNVDQGVRKFHDVKVISYQALHEIMHAIGFLHSDTWDVSTQVAGANYKYGDVTQVGDFEDKDSIMGGRNGKTYNSNGIAQLSSRDVQCLNSVASGRILSRPSRPRNLGLPVLSVPNGKPAPSSTGLDSSPVSVE